MRRWLVVLGILAGVSLARAADDTPISFAFAAQVGSGSRIEGRVVQIYRIPIDFLLPLTDERNWGVDLSLPLTLGFYDYGRRTSSRASLERRNHQPAGRRRDAGSREAGLILTPHVDAGASMDFSGDALCGPTTRASGVVSFPAGGGDARAGQELLWAGAASSGNPLTAWLGKAEAGFDPARAPVGLRSVAVGHRPVRHHERYLTAEEASATVAYTAPAPRARRRGVSINEQTEIAVRHPAEDGAESLVASEARLELPLRRRRGTACASSSARFFKKKGLSLFESIGHETRTADAAVAVRILVQVLLVVILGVPEPGASRISVAISPWPAARSRLERTREVSAAWAWAPV
jgi:hypothetical protein